MTRMQALVVPMESVSQYPHLPVAEPFSPYRYFSIPERCTRYCTCCVSRIYVNVGQIDIHQLTAAQKVDHFV